MNLTGSESENIQKLASAEGFSMKNAKTNQIRGFPTRSLEFLTKANFWQVIIIRLQIHIQLQKHPFTFCLNNKAVKILFQPILIRTYHTNKLNYSKRLPGLWIRFIHRVTPFNYENISLLCQFRSSIHDEKFHH